MSPFTIGSTYNMAVTVDGANAYYTFDDPAGPGIYRTDGTQSQSQNPLIVTYATAGLTAGDVLILRTTPKYFVVAGLRDAWVIDRSSFAHQHVFTATNVNIIDVITSRPHTTNAGVVFRTQDGLYNATGHDYYLDLTATTLGTPRDLVTAINQLGATGGCGPFRYEQGGVLYGNHYIYESTSGLVEVTLASDGTPSQTVLLTGMELRFPEVTGGGDVYASWQPSFKSNYYYVGRL